MNIPNRMLIIAADVLDISRLKRVSEALQHERENVGYKIGFTLALRYGLPQVVRALHSSGATFIVYDHQKAGTDIPQMGEAFAEVCADSSIDAAIIFPQAGPLTMASFIDALSKRSIIPIIGAHMTHPSFLVSDGGYISDDAPQKIYQQAIDLGVKDIVIPGNQPEAMVKYSSIVLERCHDAGFWFPGFGRQGGNLQAALRIIKGARAYPIVGTTIYDAHDPVAVVRDLVGQLLS